MGVGEGARTVGVVMPLRTPPAPCPFAAPRAPPPLPRLARFEGAGERVPGGREGLGLGLGLGLGCPPSPPAPPASCWFRRGRPLPPLSVRRGVEEGSLWRGSCLAASHPTWQWRRRCWERARGLARTGGRRLTLSRVCFLQDGHLPLQRAEDLPRPHHEVLPLRRDVLHFPGRQEPVPVQPAQEALEDRLDVRLPEGPPQGPGVGRRPPPPHQGQGGHGPALHRWGLHGGDSEEAG